MSTDTPFDRSALRWLNAGLEDTLAQARRALEDYVDGAGDAASLNACAEHLHRLETTLSVAQVYGAAMLAGEMETLGRALATGEIPADDSAVEVLMVGLLQLPSYLEKVEGGHPDIPLSLLPLMNDLRAARGQAAVTEISLFAPKLDKLIAAEPVEPEAADSPLAGSVRAARNGLLRGMLAWFQGEQPQDGVRQVRDFIARLAAQARTTRIRRLLDSVEALLVVVQDNGAEADADIKRLFGQFDRYLKRIQREGEQRAASDFPTALLKGLLYQVARSDSNDPAVAGVRRWADLANSFPASVEQDQGLVALAGTERELLQAVKEALGQDLRTAKDVLDLYIRGNRSESSQLQPLVDPLRRIADTLGMVGQGELRARLLARDEQVRQHGDSLSDDALMEIASDILHVESVLEGLAAPPTADASTLDRGSLLTDSELTGHVGAALQEIFVELVQIKETLGTYLEARDEPGLLARVPARLHAVAGAVRLLDLGAAGTLLERTAELIGALSEGRRPALEAGQPEALADVLTGLEYYLEAVREHRSNCEEILGFVAQSAERLGISLEAPSEPAREAGEASEALEAPEIDPRGVAEVPPEATTETVLETEIEPEPEPEPEAAIAALPLSEDIDEEILETFFEEAEEEIERIGRAYPAWRRQPADTDALQTLRRSFHTLKGSGRLVGALTIGEFSWSLENLLNRVIDGTVDPEEPLFALLDEACAAVPALVEAQRHGTSTDVDVVGLSARADTLASPEGAGEEELRAEPERLSAGAPEEEVPTEVQEPGEGEAPPAEPEPVTAEVIEPDEPVALEPIEYEDRVEDEAPVEVGAESDAEVAEPGPELAASGEIETEPESLEEPVQEPSPAPTEIEIAAESSLPPEDQAPVPGEVLPDFVMPQADTPEKLGLDPLAGVAAHLPESAPADSGDFASAAEEAFDDDTVDVDSTLLGIFCAEGRDHLDVLAAFIDRTSREAAPVDAELQRAIHTLRGSAHTAGVSEIANLSGGYDHLIALLSARSKPVDRPVIDLLERGHQALAEMLEAADQGAELIPDGNEVLEQVRAFNTRLEAEVEESERGYTAQEDSELLEIFYEESKELLEQIEEDLGRWQGNPEDRNAVAGLQRSLHTLKGGARLTGIMPLGDLSHVLESLFERVLNAELAAETALFARVRRAVDHAASALESLREGRPLPDLAGVTERLQSLVTGELSATDADSDLPLVAMADEMAGAEPQPEAPVEPEAPPPETGEPEPLGEIPEGPQVAAEVLAGEEAPEPPVDERPVEERFVAADQDSAAEPPEPEAVEPGPFFGGSRILQFPKGAIPTTPRRAAERPQSPEPESEPEVAAVERVRVRSDLLDNMVNHAGEVGIYRARLEQQNNLLGFDLQELDQTVSRLKDQLRKLEFETEAQILSRHHERADDLPLDAEFDPLEMDRYSTIQQLSRALSETVNDLTNLGTTLGDLKRDTDTLLGQQSRVSNDLQDSLLRSRMIPFSSRLARLQRVVRQTADSLGKQAELVVHGGQGEVDRSILDRMMGPLEHLLRNSVAHGIESRERRRDAGKPERGVITLELSREGPDVVLSVGDDGAGLNREAIRAKALQRGLLAPEVRLDDDTLYQLILEHGFSTAESISQIAGRGVGLDAVLREVKQLGGSLDVRSAPNSGARFTIRLPFTLALTEALLITVGEDAYAVPHTGIESVVRISRDELNDFYEGRRETFAYAGAEYQVRYLGSLLETGLPSLPKGQKWFPLMLVRAGDHRVAVHVDSLLGNRQIVVKSIGPQLSTVRWFTGGTILADGRIALILDMDGLLRADARTARPARVAMADEAPQTVTVMVVDDSITVRKVTSRLLERHDMQVVTAKDGVDAVTLLQEHRPDVMLLDIEMPRMDGYELARHMRNTKELAQIPIIMITSRSGDKHRDYARQLGVEHYLGKPYQESELLDNIFKVLNEKNVS